MRDEDDKTQGKRVQVAQAARDRARAEVGTEQARAEQRRAEQLRSDQPRPEQSSCPDPGRRRRRESFLADLDEAQRLLARVAPRRTRLAQLRQAQLMRTYLH